MLSQENREKLLELTREVWKLNQPEASDRSIALSMAESNLRKLTQDEPPMYAMPEEFDGLDALVEEFATLTLDGQGQLHSQLVKELECAEWK